MSSEQKELHVGCSKEIVIGPVGSNNQSAHCEGGTLTQDRNPQVLGGAEE